MKKLVLILIGLITTISFSQITDSQVFNYIERSTPPLNPEEGWTYFDTDDKNIYKFDGSNWVVVGIEYQTLSLNGNDLFITGGNSISLPKAVTNLSYTQSPFHGTINSSTGDNTNIPLADEINAGLVKYEEGDFTPVLMAGSGITYTGFGRGKYYKVGKMVFFSLSINGISSEGNGGIPFISGLPYRPNEIKYLPINIINGTVTDGLENVELPYLAASTYMSSSIFQLQLTRLEVDVNSLRVSFPSGNGSIFISGSYLIR